MSDAPPPPYPGDEKAGGPPQPYAPPPPGGPGYGPPPPGMAPYPQAGPPPGQPQYPQGSPYPTQQPQGYAQPGPPAYTTYGPGGPPQSTVTVVQQPTVITTVAMAPAYRESPVQTVCPHCRAQIVTATEYETGALAWLICAGLCVVGLSLGCCLIPFCIDGCKDVVHTCPNCRQHLGKYSRL